MSAPNPPYGRRPGGGGPGSPYPTPPGGMPPYGRGPAPEGPPPGQANADNPLIPPGVNGVPLPGPVPDAVQRAFLVWLVPIPLHVVAMLLTGPSSGDLGGLGVSIFGILVALVGGAFGVYLALHFRGGRNWARIVLTVISGLVLLVELFSVPASLFLIVFSPLVGVISLAISVAIAAAEVLFLVLAWKAEASAYLR